MNYFSHYLTLPKLNNPYLTIGTILPDLLRDSKLETSCFLQQDYLQFQLTPEEINLSNGIRYHLLVDKYFHNSEFFKHFTKQIASAIRSSEQLQIEKYTYFMAHIFLELYIDYLLIQQNPTQLTNFYEQLQQVEDNILIQYFKKMLPNHDFELFLVKKDKFVLEQFLMKYNSLERLGEILSLILNKVNIRALSQYEQITIVNLVAENFGMNIEQSIPGLLKEIKQL